MDGPVETAFTPEVLEQVYDTPMEVRWHSGHRRPYALMLPLLEGRREGIVPRECLQ